MGASTVDVLNLGLVSSLGKPGGNVTGNINWFDPEIDAKRLELLKEMLPSVNRVACLTRIEEWKGPWGQSAEVAAQKLGLTMVLAAHTPDNYDDALALITASGVDALFIYPGAYQYGKRKMLVDFARKYRLPDSHGFREAVEVGGLMSYGASVPGLWRRAATYVDKILKGANPGELPIMQPTKFEFVINRRTADALGVPVPPSLIALTDEVIE
jgi:putative ABC transport system substrate-binding protein